MPTMQESVKKVQSPDGGCLCLQRGFMYNLAGRTGIILVPPHEPVTEIGTTTTAAGCISCVENVTHYIKMVIETSGLHIYRGLKCASGVQGHLERNSNHKTSRRPAEPETDALTLKLCVRVFFFLNSKYFFPVWVKTLIFFCCHLSNKTCML